MQSQYKIVPAFTGGYNIIAINNSSWQEVAGPYLTEKEALTDLTLYEQGEAVDNDKQNKNYNRS